MYRPVIGIPAAEMKDERGLGYSALREHYTSALTRLGAAPLIIPREACGGDAWMRLLDIVDGILLAGGRDVDPRLYGQGRGAHTEPSDEPRDVMELGIVRAGLASQTPVLAICRGMQLMNVALGGSLYQHLQGAEGGIRHDAGLEPGSDIRERVHDIEVSPGTILASAVGEGRLDVNSAHHQGLDRLGAGLVVAAHSADGLPEAIELAGHPYAVGVQWHPEVLDGARHESLLRAFVSAASSGKM